MATAAQAIARARAIKSYTVGRCDEFVAKMYGFGSSGYSTAVANWKSTPQNLKHPGDWNAPAGALMYWSGGNTGAGHVAISLGNGSIISTDATGPGVVGQISARTPTDKWGHPYLGWAFPYFQGREATRQLGQWTGSTTVNDSSFNATQVSSDSIQAGFLSSAAVPFSGILMFVVWFGEVGIAMLLMSIGVIMLAKGFHE